MNPLRLLSRSSGLKFHKVQQDQTQPLPSAGGKAVNSSQDVGQSSKKRKRIDIEVADQDHKHLDESEIRSFHKQHKIKVTDLHVLHQDRSFSASQSQAGSAHARKEEARIYPQPLQAFQQLAKLGAHRALVANIVGQAYQEPTEVQAATIPLLLKDGSEEPNLLTVAPTGSGKTLAFLIPLIEKIVRARREEGDGVERHVSALILEPTKELVGQIVNEGRKLTNGTGVRIAEMRKGIKLLVGHDSIQKGSSEDEESDVETNGIVVKVDILVTTPLSLLNSITKKDSTITALLHVRTLILDEADYLLDPLFRDQVLSIWSACSCPELQTSLWSATIGSSVEELAISTIASRHSNLSQVSKPLFRTIIGLKDTSLPSISHKLVYASTEPGKLMGLRQLLHPASSLAKDSKSTASILRPPFLIFTQTIPRATALYDELKFDIPVSAGGSNRIAVLHSGLSSTQRAKTMTEFRQGKVWILITTDLLSRGVDFRGINGVVNYDIPTTAASYVHRAGRTGRAGREGGICVTFYTREDVKYLKPIANLVAASEKKAGRNGSVVDTNSNGAGIPSWLLSALPELSKQDRKELKQRGVGVRRAVKESDDKEDKRKKGKNRIGTSSGYERKLENKRTGMIEGSRRRKRKEMDSSDDESVDGNGGFEGFGD